MVIKCINYLLNNFNFDECRKFSIEQLMILFNIAYRQSFLAPLNMCN